MKKIFSLCLIILFLLIQIACRQQASAFPKAENAEEIQKAIDSLYLSFSFNAGEEPLWNTLRALTLPGARFVSEPDATQKRKAIDVEDFIAEYKKSIAETSRRNTGYSEHILETQIWQSGTVAQVEVKFRAIIPGENIQRKPGIDDLQLVNDKGQWKIVAMTTQSESKP